MNFIVWIIFGALAGWIASMVMGKNAQMGALANIVVGIVGALIGGFLMTNVFGAQGVTGFNLTSLLVAIVGAAAVVVFGFFMGTSSGVHPDMTVLNKRGLVGRVIRADLSTSTVLLIVDRESVVGGRLGSSQEVGFLRGRGALGDRSQVGYGLRQALVRYPGTTTAQVGLGSYAGVGPNGLAVRRFRQAPGSLPSQNRSQRSRRRHRGSPAHIAGRRPAALLHGVAVWRGERRPSDVGTDLAVGAAHAPPRGGESSSARS